MTDDAVPSGVQGSKLPTKAMLTAQEVLNWIAFGKADDIDRIAWQRQRFWETWEWLPDDQASMRLLALREMAGLPIDWPKSPTSGASLKDHPRFALVRLTSAELVAKAGRPALELALLMEMQIKLYRSAVDRVFSATCHLIEAAKSGNPAAVATPVAPGELARQIDPAIFSTPRLWIDKAGQMSVGGEVRFNGLEFRTADVRELLFPTDQADMSISGMPGRPTSKHLVLAEMKRRSECGPLALKVIDEARVLREWLGVAHEEMPQPTVKSIAAVIRDDYRETKSRKL